MAHVLKRLASNIGAKRLQQTAAALELVRVKIAPSVENLDKETDIDSALEMLHHLAKGVING